MAEDLENSLSKSDLAEKLQLIKKKAKDEYLTFWQVHAPHFTDHGENHCKAIEMTLKEILDPNIISSLNEYEIFMLLSGIWLHDIGLIIKKTLTETDQEIRESHHIRSREMIRSQFGGLLSPQEGIIIGDIAWGHSRQADITTLGLTKTIRHPEIGNKEIRQRFLAALLRFFDALDICHTRTSETVIAFSLLSERSKFYHAIHCRVSGLIREGTEILIDINYSNDDEIPILFEYIVASLNYELESVRDILAENAFVITAIVPRYNYVEGLDSLPNPPDPSSEVEDTIPESFKLFQIKMGQFSSHLRNGNVEEAQKLIDALVEEYSDDALTWNTYGTFYTTQINNEEKALRGYQNAVNIEPDSPMHLSSLGHYLGEYLHDIDQSFEYFEKVYLSPGPGNDMRILNYVEALITKVRFEDANKLARKILQTSSYLHYICLATFFSFCCSCLIDNSLEYKKDESELLFRILQETNERGKPWIFNKLYGFLLDSEEVSASVANFLTDIIDYFDEDITLGELLEIRDEIFGTE